MWHHIYTMFHADNNRCASNAKVLPPKKYDCIVGTIDVRDFY
jgi:hypothetical protein